MTAANTKSLLMRGALWIALTRIIINLAGFASTVVLARLLVPTDFGLVAIAVSIGAVITGITELSLSQALIQNRDPTRDHFDTAFTLNLIRSLILGLVVAAAAKPVAWSYGDDRLFPIMLVTAGVTVLTGIVNPKMVIFQRQLVFRQEFVLSVSKKMVGLIASIVIAFVYHSYWALIVGSAATELTAMVISFWLFPYWPRLCLKKTRELLSFSIWLTFNYGIRTINWRMDSLLIGYALGSNPLGQYSMADNLAGLPTREALAPVSTTLFPAFSRINHDMDRLRAAFSKSNAVLCAIAFPIGFGFAAIAKPLILLLLSSKWQPTIAPIEVLAVTIALQTAGWSMLPVGQALGQTRAVFNRELISFLVRIPFLFGGLWLGQATSLGGFMGVVWGRAVAALIGTLLNQHLVRRLIKVSLRQQWLQLVRPFVASVLMFLAVRQVIAASATLSLAVQVGAGAMTGGIVYALASLALWMLQGRPDGPESEAFHLTAGLRQRWARFA